MSLVHVCEDQSLCRRTKLNPSSISISYQKDSLSHGWLQIGYPEVSVQYLILVQVGTRMKGP